MGQGSDRGNNT